MSLPMGGPFRDDDPVSADNSFAINSKIMIVAVVVLFGVVMFILGLHIYAKWFWRQGGLHGGSSGGGWRRRRRLEFAADLQGHQRTTTHVGLEKSVLDQLPIFTFDEEKASVNKEGALECAVCLEEFADGEKGRLLPKCNHSFHIDCIDMWFHSHSTCPLCRCSVDPESSSPSAVAILVRQPSDASKNDDGVGALPSPSGAVVLNVSDGVADSGRSSDCTINVSDGVAVSGRSSDCTVNVSDGVAVSGRSSDCTVNVSDGIAVSGRSSDCIIRFCGYQSRNEVRDQS